MVDDIGIPTHTRAHMCSSAGPRQSSPPLAPPRAPTNPHKCQRRMMRTHTHALSRQVRVFKGSPEGVVTVKFKAAEVGGNGYGMGMGWTGARRAQGPAGARVFRWPEHCMLPGAHGIVGGLRVPARK